MPNSTMPTMRRLFLAVACIFGCLVAVRVVWIAAAISGNTTSAVRICLALITVGIAIWSVSMPAVAIYATLVLACFEQQIILFGITTGTAEIALILFAPALFLQWARAPFAPGVLRWGALLVVSGSAITVLVANDRQAASWGLSRWLVVLNLALAVGSRLHENGPREQLKMAKWIAALGGAVAGFAIAQEHGFYFIVGPPYLDDRIDSTFGYYTVFAGFIAISTVVTAGLTMQAITHRMPRTRLVTMILLPLQGYVAMIALSRGALLAISVGLLGLAFGRISRPGKMLQSVTFLILTASLTVTIVPAETQALLKERFRTEQGGDVQRQSLHEAGAALLANKPGGIGYDNFQGYIERGDIYTLLDTAHSHSLYSQQGLDTGWIGLAGFILICLAALVAVARRALATGGGHLSLLYGCALAGALAQGFNDYLFYEIGYLAVFMTLVAAALTSALGPRNPEPGRGGSKVGGTVQAQGVSDFRGKAVESYEPVSPAAAPRPARMQSR